MSIKDIELDLEKKGLTLVEGLNHSNETFHSNGSGKSTLLSSITYALYGQTPSGLRADDVVNRIEGKGTSVILYFSIDDQNYRIERYRKHKTQKNKVKLYQGNTELTGKSMKDTEEKIQELFGIDYNTYMNSIIQGQGDAEVFSKASDKGKKEILENITNIAIYKKAQDIAKEKVKEKKLDITSVERDVEELEREIKQTKEREQEEKESYQHTLDSIKESEEKIKELEVDLEKHRLSYPKDLEDRLHYLEGKVAPRYPNNALDDLQEVTSIEEEIEYLKRALVDRNEETKAEYSGIIKEFENQVKNIDEQVQPMLTNIQILKSEVTNQRAEVDKLDLRDTCPFCGQNMDVEHKKKEHARILEEIATKEDKIKVSEDVYNNELVPMIDDLKYRAEEKTKEFQTIVSERETELNGKIEELNKQIQDIKEEAQREVREKYDREQEEYEEAMRERDKLNSQKNNYKQEESLLVSHIETEKNMLERLNKLPKPKDRAEEIAKLDIELKEKNTERLACIDKIDKYEDVVKLYSNTGVRSVVLDLVTPFLNERANKYMATLSGSDIEILFSTQTENKDGSLSDKFDVEVKNASGGNTYKSNSEGEKKRIDLAISFAIQDLVLSKNDMRTNLAIYDECFEGLDEIGSENVIKLLKERSEKVDTIFVITHNQHLASLFENTITVEKRDGLTRLVET